MNKSEWKEFINRRDVLNYELAKMNDEIQKCPYNAEFAQDKSRDVFCKAVDRCLNLAKFEKFTQFDKVMLYNVYEKISNLKVESYPQSISYTYDSDKVYLAHYPSQYGSSTSIAINGISVTLETSKSPLSLLPAILFLGNLWGGGSY
jgi:hypothetical protein